MYSKYTLYTYARAPGSCMMCAGEYRSDFLFLEKKTKLKTTASIYTVRPGYKHLYSTNKTKKRDGDRRPDERTKTNARNKMTGDGRTLAHTFLVGYFFVTTHTKQVAHKMAHVLKAHDNNEGHRWRHFHHMVGPLRARQWRG